MIDFDAEIAEFTCGPNGFDAAAFEEIVAILEAARA
jgi:hypothetical protein